VPSPKTLSLLSALLLHFSSGRQGDSGGPMSVERTDGKYNLAGIISWGIGCAKRNQPGVMTRIAYFRDWINTIIKF